MNKDSLFIFVGDISADKHTAKILQELKHIAPGLHIWGCGGNNMEAQGVEILYNCEEFGVFGIIEVLRMIPFLARLRNQLKTLVKERKPTAVLLVDFGGFNLKLAQSLHRQNPDLPIIYCISPQIWGSRPWRIKTIIANVSKMLVIFPFEEVLFRNAGVDVSFIGHPLISSCDNKRTTITKEQFCRQLNLDSSKPIIGIFPGSRKQEIKDLMPVILQAIKWLSTLRPDLQFVVSRANTNLADAIDFVIEKNKLNSMLGHGLTLAPIGENHTLMTCADFLWVKSGTTTLEAALADKPMLIFYRANWISYLLFLLFKKVQYVGWPNLLAGKLVIPELIQLDCRAEQLVKRTLDFLDVPGVQKEMARQLAQVKDSLGQGDFALDGAKEILKIIEQRKLTQQAEVS